jgi:hypothetical protein
MPLFDKNNYDMLYNDYNKMRNAVPTQPIAYRTVFNDIADEWANCTEEERRFIDGDPEYVNANLTYQQQFNAFLLDMVGLQFINSQYGKSAESVLVTLKNAKAKYKKEAAESIASVKAENAALQKQLEELKILVSSGGRS